LEVTDADGKVISLSEFIMTVENSTYAITAYNSDGDFVQNVSARTNLYNFGGSGNKQQYYDRQIMLLSMPEKFHVKARVYFNDTKLSLNPTSGISSKRPNSAMINSGFQYFDTTLGKPIYYNGTSWVDATGAAV
jgi:hypothetical protein